MNSNRIRASGPFRIVDIPKELLVFSRLGRRRSGKHINFSKNCKFSEMGWNSVTFNKIALETQKNWFWEVRGRKWAPEWLKYLWITAVFTRRRKGAIFLPIWEILVNSAISPVLMQNHKIQRISTKNQETTDFHKSATLHETFCFS